jgi:hypothetical protein
MVILLDDDTIVATNVIGDDTTLFHNVTSQPKRHPKGMVMDEFVAEIILAVLSHI